MRLRAMIFAALCALPALAQEDHVEEPLRLDADLTPAAVLDAAAERHPRRGLLDAQAADGSWRSSIMSTRLAATSLVMNYLPKALDRLGGIVGDFC